MANLIYEDFLIVAAADRDKFTGQWIPIASISWQESGGRRAVHFLTNLPERFSNSEEAVTYGLTAAKTWVDQRVT
jgi:hypothetical protein